MRYQVASIFLPALIFVGSTANEEPEDEPLNILLNEIFGHYRKELVPKRPTVVKMDLLLLKVKSTIEKEGIVESVIALFMNWKDKRMTWNSANYENVTTLAFDSDMIWLPDVAMTNSADHYYSISKDYRFVVRVSSDGSMTYVPTGTSRTWCDLNYDDFSFENSFPFFGTHSFDMQTCSFEFESWSMSSKSLTFHKSSEALVDESFSSPQWALCHKQAVLYEQWYEFSQENFTRLRFDFVIRRKPMFYIINLIFPCATLSIIQLLVYVIPSTDSTSDRIGFGTTNLLTLVVFQTIVTAEMPKSSDAVTALSKYIIVLIITSAVCIFQSVLIEMVLRLSNGPPPNWLEKVVHLYPMTWAPQLPSGIQQMLLEGSGYEVAKDSKVNNNTRENSEISSENSSETCTRRRRNRVKMDNREAISLEYHGINLLSSPIYDRWVDPQSATRIMNNSTKSAKSSPCIRMYSRPPMASWKLGGQNGIFGEKSAADSNASRNDSKSDKIEVTNGMRWGRLVTKVDHCTFLLCFIVSLVMPIYLFIPLQIKGVHLCGSDE